MLSGTPPMFWPKDGVHQQNPVFSVSGYKFIAPPATTVSTQVKILYYKLCYLKLPPKI